MLTYTRIGDNRDLQPAKVLTIPTKGINANDNNNEYVYAFVLTYGLGVRSYLFDVGKTTDGAIVNEYHFDDDETNRIYYKVDDEGIHVYVNLIWNRRAYISCLQEPTFMNVKYYSLLDYTSEELTPANIIKQNVSGSAVMKSKVVKSEIENVFAKSYGIYSDNQTLTIDLTSILGNQDIRGCLRMMNYNDYGADGSRYCECVIHNGVVTMLTQSGVAPTVTADNAKKTVSIGNISKGWVTVFFQPINADGSSYELE